MLTLALLAAAVIAPGDWPNYGRDPGGSRYSPLTQVNTGNVAGLQIAWRFHTRDMYPETTGRRASSLQATPLYVDGTLFLSTPFGRVIALDGDTGTQRWAYDPHIDPAVGYGDFANRGVATWTPDGKSKRRIFVATIDARLIALEAATGEPCTDFGKQGQIDLRAGLRIPAREKSEYQQTSPPTVVGNVVITGSAIADNARVDLPSGEVRGFDVITGRLLWTWHSIPQEPGDPAFREWKPEQARNTGGANAWSVLSSDPERGLVFVPPGSPAPDYFGGMRTGNNLYGNSVIALKADTGKAVWHFQTVHHDLWDYDVASPPTLFTFLRAGKPIPAIAVGSKTGHLFLLDRLTGKPLFKVEERPVPASDVPGEVASPTQPFPVLPKPLTPHSIQAADAWGPSEADRKFCAETFASLRNEGIFTPPSLKTSLIVPGNIGGMAWGGAAFDAANHLLIVPANRLVAAVRLIPRDQVAKARKADPASEFAPQEGTPYAMQRKFILGPGGAPCNRPPWGTLAAIDANTGLQRWEVPLGHFPHAAKVPGGEQFGSPVLGGPIVTAGGLVFMGGTFDPHLRAFDTLTGKELWRGKLPTSARATPMTFQTKAGRQFVVIAAGGHNIPGISAQGDEIVAFALPEEKK